MTSKLPVVGKRYKRKALGCSYQIVVENILDDRHIVCSIVPDGKTKWNRFTYQPHYFWDDFEEIPDSNPQEVEEDCPFETAAEEWNTTKVKKVSEKFYCKTCLNDTSEDIPCRQHSKDICCTCYNRKCDERIEDYNKVSEVERALEELKEELKEIEKIHFRQWYLDNQDNPNFDNYPVSLYTLLNRKAQNLVKALEAEKANTKIQAEELVDNKIQDMSKPEPQIDIKEERVEPVDTTITVQYETNGRVMTPYEQIEEILEQIQKDIEELKRNASD